MKPSFKFLLLAAAMTCGIANGVESTTAYTTPVGYVTMSVPAEADTTIGQPLIRPPVFSGQSTGVSGDIVTVAANSFVADQLVYASPSQTNTYYILVTSGSLEGRYFEVSSNTTDTVTILSGDATLQSMGFTAGDKMKVLPYWTLNTLFPSGSGVGVTTEDIFSPVAMVQFKDNNIGQDRAASRTYFYYNGTEESGSGWYDNDNLGGGLQNDLVIDPSLIATIRNTQGTPNSVVVTGEVPGVVIKTPVTTGVSTNDNYVNTQLPVDISLAESGLSSVLTPATDIFSPIDTVFIYNDEATGYDKASYRTFFYYVGTEEAGAGWYDNDALGDGLQDNNKLLKSGRAYVIRRASGTPETVQAATPIPYTL